MGLRMVYTWAVIGKEDSHAGTGNISIPSPLVINDAIEQGLRVLREQWPGYRVKITPISVAVEEEERPSKGELLSVMTTMIFVAGAVAAIICTGIMNLLK